MRHPVLSAFLIAALVLILGCIFGPGVKQAAGAEPPARVEPESGSCYSADEILSSLLAHKGMIIQAEWRSPNGQRRYFLVGNANHSVLLVQQGRDLCVVGFLRAFTPATGLPL